jgi:hypothetical protein
MRGLKVLVVVMGVMIVAGTATLGVVIVRRLGGPGAGSGAGSGTGSGAGAAIAAVLDEPAGTRIAGVAGAGERFVVTLSGGGVPDRAVLVDARSGAVVGRLGLAR